MKNKFLIYGALAVGGYFLYKHLTKKSAVVAEGTSEFVRSRTSRRAGKPCMGNDPQACKDACAANGMTWSAEVGSVGGAGGCIPTSAR